MFGAFARRPVCYQRPSKPSEARRSTSTWQIRFMLLISIFVIDNAGKLVEKGTYDELLVTEHL